MKKEADAVAPTEYINELQLESPILKLEKSIIKNNI